MQPVYLPPNGACLGAGTTKNPIAEVMIIIALPARDVNRIFLFFQTFFQKGIAKRRRVCYNIPVTQGYSSVGRVLVSKTMGRGFESFCPCQNKKGRHSAAFFVLAAAEPPKSRSTEGAAGLGDAQAHLLRTASGSLTSRHALRAVLLLAPPLSRWAFLLWRRLPDKLEFDYLTFPTNITVLFSMLNISSLNVSSSKTFISHMYAS